MQDKLTEVEDQTITSLSCITNQMQLILKLRNVHYKTKNLLRILGLYLIHVFVGSELTHSFIY